MRNESVRESRLFTRHETIVGRQRHYVLLYFRLSGRLASNYCRYNCRSDVCGESARNRRPSNVHTSLNRNSKRSSAGNVHVRAAETGGFRREHDLFFFSLFCRILKRTIAKRRMDGKCGRAFRLTFWCNILWPSARQGTPDGRARAERRPDDVFSVFGSRFGNAHRFFRYSFLLKYRRRGRA